MTRHAPRRLTDRFIQSLKPEDERYDVSDLDVRGLHIRVSPHGSRTFVLCIRYPGAKYPTRRSLGPYPEVTLSDARDEAIKWRGMVRKGIDPKQEERERRRAEDAKRNHTVAAVAEIYIKHKVSKLKSARQIEADIRREVVTRWGDRPITSITRQDVISMIRAIAQTAPYSARNVYAAVRALFNWSLHEGAYNLAKNPCEGLRVDEIIGEDREARDRVLTDAEIRALWQASTEMGFPWGTLNQLLLLTGCRRAEIAEARWSEFDVAGRVLRIPRARTKTNEQHDVPLSLAAMEILTSVPRFDGGQYILSVAGHSPLAGHADSKKRLDRLMAERLGCHAADFRRGGERAFVLHDLRRTVRTRLAHLRVDFITAELILGHSLAGIHGTYDKHKYEAEKREALEKLANHIRELVGNEPTQEGLPTTGVEIEYEGRLVRVH
jgi:integrase